MDMRHIDAATQAMRTATEGISLSAEEEALLANDEETRDTLRLMVSAEQSLLRQHHPCPDIDHELHRICPTPSAMLPMMPGHRSLRSYLYGALIGAAAMLAIIAGIGYYRSLTPEKQMLSQVIQSAGDAEVATITTTEGETLTLNMADGTTITLNNSSRLEYPRRFQGPTRTVHLQGEALFKVSKDSRHPFVVLTQDMITTVHGTIFDVKAYPAQPTSVALVEGSVEVRKVGSKVSRLIKPGEKAELRSDELTVLPVNTAEETAWSEGQFYFDNRRLEEIASNLGQWYQLPVIFKDSTLKDLRLNFAIQRHQSIDETLALLNSLNRFKATLDHNQIVIE